MRDSSAEFRISMEKLGLNSAFLAARLDVAEREVSRWMRHPTRIAPPFAWEYLQEFRDHIEHEASEAFDAVMQAISLGVGVKALWTYKTDERSILETGIPAAAHRVMIGAVMDLMEEEGRAYRVRYFEEIGNYPDM